MALVDDDAAGRAAALTALGLEPAAAATAARSAKATAALLDAARVAGIDGPPELTGEAAASGGGRGGGGGKDSFRKPPASLLNTALVKLPPSIPEADRAVLFRAIGARRVATMPQLDAGLVHLAAAAAAGDAVTPAGLDEAAGVGVVIADADINAAVAAVLAERSADIAARRYRTPVGSLLGPALARLRFADPGRVLPVIQEQLAGVLGPKTEADLAKPVKLSKAAKAAAAAATTAAAAAASATAAAPAVASATGAVGGADAPLAEAPPSAAGATRAGAPPAPLSASDAAAVDKAGEDLLAGVPNTMSARLLKDMENSPELLAAAKAATGGGVVTRFPPEPNGHLHVGHAKAMFMDFGVARKAGGACILRFDDTNPVTEKVEYMDSIQEMVRWLGHKPTRVTYSSDYFDRLYELAEELIDRGKAYVCHQTSAEMKAGRETKTDSPWRNRSVAENRRHFAAMRAGRYAEGTAVLRMKIDMGSLNPCMQDPIAYRIKYAPHPHVGDAWCVYPSYDYTHCIVDSLEWVTHSLCTLEFEIRRDSYYWLLAALDLYRPFVWEFSRLTLAHTVVSKRRLAQLVSTGTVRGWDDPRMSTLVGLRRRGYPAEAINRFCAAVGVSRGENLIPLHVLEHWVRTHLDSSAPRTLGVLHPLRVTLTNFRGNGRDGDVDGVEVLSVANHPKNAAMGTRSVPLTREVFIDRADFRETDAKNYYGLAPGKTAMLRGAYPLRVTGVRRHADGTVAGLEAELDYGRTTKPRGVLHWVSAAVGHHAAAEVRLHSPLFRSADASKLGSDDWLADIDPTSEEVVAGAVVEKGLADAVTAGDRFQFERVGYFCADPDSRPGLVVFNRIVSLRESTGRAGIGS
ncbi:hypothetical protein MMPV_000098 [Pyropia vietnamensis]